MTMPLSESSLEDFRAAAAGGEPTPAGVAIAAASASFALGLLAKVAAVSARHKKFAQHSGKLHALAEAAAAESRRALRLAEQDVAAFKACVAGNRLPQSTEAEREARQRAIHDAVREAIEIPLAAARSAAKGLELCSEAAGATHTTVIADLGAAASLLANAMRVFLMCADSNLGQLAVDPAQFRGAFAGRKEMETRAYRLADEVLKQVASAIESLGAKPEPQS